MLNIALFELSLDIVKSVSKVFQSIDDTLLNFQLKICDGRLEIIIHFISITQTFFNVFLDFFLLIKGALDHSLENFCDAHPQGFVSRIILSEKHIKRSH